MSFHLFTRDFIFGHHLGTFEIKDQISEKKQQPKKKNKQKNKTQTQTKRLCGSFVPNKETKRMNTSKAPLKLME